VIVDPKLQIPLETRLVTTARQIPTTIACRDTMLAAADPRAGQLADAGVELIGLPHGDEPVPLAPLLRMLVARHDVTNVLVEAGAGLLGALFHQRLVNEAWVFIAPLLLGDDEAMPAVRGLVAPGLADAARLRLVSKRQRGEDIVLRYRVGDEA
jgi:diaminohydroxyphosphoribosylaminopyrimidine deaminase/5-amino-6-(5-phosphoribosylamino)uracil reductase